MSTPLKASAISAGALLAASRFSIPQFQREYSWGDEEVREFWKDLKRSLDSDSYFLGLIILTDDPDGKIVVDGQQRLITLSLLATAIYHRAEKLGRKALADRIQADFLRAIDYESDATHPRVALADQSDNATFQHILSAGQSPHSSIQGSVSERIVESFDLLQQLLNEDLAVDPFKRLGKWSDFITNKLYFAVFVHPDTLAAYQVYEVINTRGKDLTTADLLKNFVLSQTPSSDQDVRYKEWRDIARQFPLDGTNNFVQYIRHVVTVRSGYVLPRDLFAFLADRLDPPPPKRPPSPPELMAQLQSHLSLYQQMINPTLDGPAEPEMLRIFEALNSLGVIAVRPILLALGGLPDGLDGMKYVLRLVVRRIVAGGLGTGNVDRRFGEAAKRVFESGTASVLQDELGDLMPEESDFVDQLKKRSLPKSTLSFIRRSIVQQDITPTSEGALHLVWTKQVPIGLISPEDGPSWSSTIGNTLLLRVVRRPKAIHTWTEFKSEILPHAVAGEWTGDLAQLPEWSVASIKSLGERLAKAAGKIWYA